MVSNILFSHKTDDWKTLQCLYKIFINKIKCVDPCPFPSILLIFNFLDNLGKRYYYLTQNELVDFLEDNYA